eukprot:6212405-Pleurochrysis_carterae.AAC.3
MSKDTYNEYNTHTDQQGKVRRRGLFTEQRFTWNCYPLASAARELPSTPERTSSTTATYARF